MTEEQLWRWMRTEHLPPGHFDRIESFITPGLPDVSYAVKGREGWIELKATNQKSGHPFRGERKGLRPAQLLWIDQRRRLGSRVLIAAAMGHDFALWNSSIIWTFNDSSWDELFARALLWVPRRNCRVLPVELFRG